MKYFTPELFVRTQDMRDEPAMEDWERSVSGYVAFLKEALPHLPKPLRRIAEKFNLHDADVLSMSRSGDTLSITLQLDPPLDSLLVLTYTLVAPPVIERDILPREHCSEHAAWLYDEISLAGPACGSPDRESSAAGENGRLLIYSHDILLSNGWEIHLRFRKFKLSHPKALIPAPSPSPGATEPPVPQSA